MRPPSFATDSSLIDDSINGHYGVLIPRSRKFLAEEGPSNRGDRCTDGISPARYLHIDLVENLAAVLILYTFMLISIKTYLSKED